MISNTLLNKFILKYASGDVNDATKEYRDKVNNDPELYSKMREDDNRRNKAYHERQRENPSEAFINRQRGKSQSLKELKDSGSLDGIAKLMSTSIATYKNELKKAIMRKMTSADFDPAKIAESPIVKQWEKDSSELYYLRDKIKELGEALRFEEVGKPLRPEKASQLVVVKNLCDSYLEKFQGKYPSILKHIVSAIDKMRTIAGAMILWDKF